MRAPQRLRARVPRRPGPRAGFAAEALAVALTAAACTGGSPNAGSASAAAPPTEAGITSIPAGQRRAAPAISGTTLQGRPLALRSFTGHVVVLNVWGSWCTECRDEQRALEDAFQADRARAVQFLGINSRDDATAARTYQSTYSVTYPSLQDPDESLLLRFASVLPPNAVPSTAIIDRHGRIAVRILGAVTRSELQQQIDTVLSEP
ncbi:MAG: TlpA family protein disulfide reductase [Actinocrinis sp.]